MQIRKFTEQDYPMISEWWGNSEAKPTLDALPDTTFIIETDKPIATASLFLTNCKYAAWIEHLVGNPEIDKEVRKQAVSELFGYLENLAKDYGYQAVCLFSYVDKLKQRYMDLGFIPTKDNITVFAKRI